MVFHEFIEFMDCVFYFGANIRIRIMPQKPKKEKRKRETSFCVCEYVCVFVPKSAGIPNHLDSNIHLFYMLNRYNGHISLPSQNTLNWSPKNTREKKQWLVIKSFMIVESISVDVIREQNSLKFFFFLQFSYIYLIGY